MDNRDSGSECDPDSKEETSLQEPAFTFDKTHQRPIYPRTESWEKLEDVLMVDIEQHLRKAGIRNCSKREKHDAVVRLAAKHPEELAELIIEARR